MSFTFNGWSGVSYSWIFSCCVIAGTEVIAFSVNNSGTVSTTRDGITFDTSTRTVTITGLPYYGQAIVIEG